MPDYGVAGLTGYFDDPNGHVTDDRGLLHGPRYAVCGALYPSRQISQPRMRLGKGSPELFQILTDMIRNQAAKEIQNESM